MTETLEYTGERFTPECVREIWHEHFHRYVFAAAFCAGQDVLDAACGEGYGADLLARTAATVTGIDVDTAAIDHAGRRYGGRENLDFRVADCTALPFDDDSFDRVVSFETLEHLDAHEQLMTEFRRVLRPDGVLLISTPDKARYSDEQGFENEYHVRELYRDEFEALLGRHFPATRLFGQKLVFSSAIWSLGEMHSVRMDQFDAGAVQRRRTYPPAAMYYLALCAESDDHLPVADADLWLFDDADESVYAHYHGEIRRNMAAGGIIADRDREIERLRQALEGHGRPRSWWRRWFSRD